MMKGLGFSLNSSLPAKIASMRRWQFSLRSLVYLLTGSCLLAAAVAWVRSSPQSEEIALALLGFMIAWAAAVLWMAWR